MLKDEDEVYTYLGGIVEVAATKAGPSDKLAGSGVVLRIHYTDPDSTITVHTGQDRGNRTREQCRA